MEKKEETPMKEETTKKVTKEKHPGRVESGKRLAERNRLKKLELKNKEHKEKIITQEEPVTKESYEYNKTIEEPVEVNIYKTSNISYLIVAGIIGGGIYIGYQKYKVSSPVTKEIKIEKPEKSDPFYME